MYYLDSTFFLFSFHICVVVNPNQDIQETVYMETETLVPIMAHMVIGYPSLEQSKEIAEKYIASGMEILELQIPFSHPTADGTVLTQANKKAVESGTTLEKSLDFLQEVRKKHPAQKIMAMTYINKLFSYGLGNFCDELKKSEIPYLIVPDLPFDSSIAQAIHEHDYVQLVPVLSANTSDQRLAEILKNNPDYVYIIADYKITGGTFSINPKVQKVIDFVKGNSETKVGLGFGISERKQVDLVLEIADFAIIGTALTRAVEDATIDEKLKELAGN